MVPDYYEMLGVDPRAGPSAIARALERCLPVWSSGTRNPKAKLRSQAALDLVPALRQALLAGPDARAAYDRELAAWRRSERDRQIDELERRVRLRAAKGYLTDSDRATLRIEAVRRGLSEDDLARLIAAVPARPAARAAAFEEQNGELLGPSVRRQLKITLDHLGRKDLYEALELPRESAPNALRERAEALRRHWARRVPNTAEKSAWLDVAAFALTHLGTPEARARYDRTLVAESQEAFADVVRFTLAGAPRLGASTLAALIEEAARLGISPEQARLVIDRLDASERLGPDREANEVPRPEQDPRTRADALALASRGRDLLESDPARARVLLENSLELVPDLDEALEALGLVEAPPTAGPTDTSPPADGQPDDKPTPRVLEAPTQLQSTRVATAFHLRWDWPDEVATTLLLIKHGGDPTGPDDPEADRLTITRAAYDRLGYVPFQPAPHAHGPWHLALFSIQGREDRGPSVPGSPARLVLQEPARPRTIAYSIVPPRFPHRSWVLTFHTDPPGLEVPPTALVVNRRTVPLSVDDGVVVDVFPAAHDGACFRARSRRGLDLSQARLFPDPRAEPTSLHAVRFRHPQAGGTRV